MGKRSNSSFNLVIEYLLISTRGLKSANTKLKAGFNLVIEYLLISTIGHIAHFADISDWSFNLVIEYLLISALKHSRERQAIGKFQSRNRVSSNFNLTATRSSGSYWRSFNLVIEYLLISTEHHSAGDRRVHCFNLVIEYLLISTLVEIPEVRARIMVVSIS